MNKTIQNPIRKERVTNGVLPLTKREIQILTLLSEGLNKNQISDHLGIAHATVAAHARNIYHKLGVVNVGGAVGTGFRRGILSPR